MRLRTVLLAVALPVLAGCTVLAVTGAVVSTGVAVTTTVVGAGVAVGKGAVKVATYPFRDSDEEKLRKAQEKEREALAKQQREAAED